MFWRQLRETCSHSGLVWPVLHHILSEYGDLLSQRAHHVESTSILHGYYVDLLKTKFRRISTSFLRTFSMWFRSRKIHLVATYFFRCNFSGRKIRIISKYFFWCNFNGRKVHVISRYFYQCNFDDRNMQVVFTYFFRRNFDGQRFDIVFGKL